jgi:hypothetical protein
VAGGAWYFHSKVHYPTHSFHIESEKIQRAGIITLAANI